MTNRTIATISTTGLTAPISILRRILNPTDRRVRLLAGLLPLGLLFMQCVSNSVTPAGQASGVAVAKPIAAPRGAADLEGLARTDHMALLQYCLDNYRGKYTDYTCTFTKQERIGGVLGAEQEIHVRFRDSPFSEALTWVANPPRCDRLLYVEGWNNNDMLARPTSSLLQALVPKGVSRRPDDEAARKVTLRTVDQFGFERGLKSLLAVYQEGKKGGDLREEFGGYYTVDGRDTLMLTRYLTTKRKDYPACKTLTYIDVKYLVPVMVEGYDWGAGDFLCRYAFSDVKFNVGLTGADFTPESIGLKRN
jgi:hypothetical protein